MADKNMNVADYVFVQEKTIFHVTKAKKIHERLNA
jgi:hypothetical protein